MTYRPGRQLKIGPCRCCRRPVCWRAPIRLAPLPTGRGEIITSADTQLPIGSAVFGVVFVPGANTTAPVAEADVLTSLKSAPGLAKNEYLRQSTCHPLALTSACIDETSEIATVRHLSGCPTTWREQERCRRSVSLSIPIIQEAVRYTELSPDRAQRLSERPACTS